MAATKPKPLFDPMEPFQKLMEATKPQPPFDLTSPFEKLMAAIKPKPLFDPAEPFQKLMEATKPQPFLDPTGPFEKLMAATKPKPLFDPMEQSRRLADLWGAQKSFDAVDKYQRILGQFSALDPGNVYTPTEDAALASSPIPSRESLLSMPSASLVVALAGIAWTCAWLIASGADVNALGGLFIEAFGLTLLLIERTRST